jgi:hypothetical protein
VRQRGWHTLIVLLLAFFAVSCGESPAPTAAVPDAQVWIPNSETELGPIYSLAALSDNSVWAVAETKSEPTQAVLLHWDGTGWKTKATIGDAAHIYVLRDLAVLSDTDIWAVGSRTSTITKSNKEVLVAHWDGASLSFEIPLQTGVPNELRSIAASRAMISGRWARPGRAPLWSVGTARNGRSQQHHAPKMEVITG